MWNLKAESVNHLFGDCFFSGHLVLTNEFLYVGPQLGWRFSDG